MLEESLLAKWKQLSYANNFRQNNAFVRTVNTK